MAHSEKRVCMFYRNGINKCRNGDRCAFQHADIVPEAFLMKIPVCNFYGTRTGCKSGSKCAFRHVQENSENIRPRSKPAQTTPKRDQTIPKTERVVGKTLRHPPGSVSHEPDEILDAQADEDLDILIQRIAMADKTNYQLTNYQGRTPSSDHQLTAYQKIRPSPDQDKPKPREGRSSQSPAEIPSRVKSFRYESDSEFINTGMQKFSILQNVSEDEAEEDGCGESEEAAEPEHEPPESSGKKKKKKRKKRKKSSAPAEDEPTAEAEQSGSRGCDDLIPDFVLEDFSSTIEDHNSDAEKVKRKAIKREADLRCSYCSFRVTGKKFQDAKMSLSSHHLSKLEGCYVKHLRELFEKLGEDICGAKVPYCKVCDRPFTQFKQLIHHFSCKVKGKKKGERKPHMEQLQQIADLVTARDISVCLRAQGYPPDGVEVSNKLERPESVIMQLLTTNCMAQKDVQDGGACGGAGGACGGAGGACSSDSETTKYDRLMVKLGLRNIGPRLARFIAAWHRSQAGAADYDEELNQRKQNFGFTRDEIIELRLQGIRFDDFEAVEALEHLYEYMYSDDEFADECLCWCLTDSEDDDDDDNDDDSDEDQFCFCYPPNKWIALLEKQEVPMGRVKCGQCSVVFQKNVNGCISPHISLQNHYKQKLAEVDTGHVSMFDFHDTARENIQIVCRICNRGFKCLADLLQHATAISNNKTAAFAPGHAEIMQQICLTLVCRDISTALDESDVGSMFNDDFCLEEASDSFINIFLNIKNMDVERAENCQKPSLSAIKKPSLISRKRTKNHLLMDFAEAMDLLGEKSQEPVREDDILAHNPHMCAEDNCQRCYVFKAIVWVGICKGVL